ncbi:probable helicase with zinc finger domain [Ptychodera flava]|uniref:probable helicase with zinc finger domain n=1 Tax=Ptychodera flava TaxID=63121 RepID=UPI00396A2929
MDSKHKELADKANDQYQKQQYKEAAKTYSEALETLAPRNNNSSTNTRSNVNGSNSQTSTVETQISYLSSRATCYLKLKQYEKLVEDCNSILALSDNKNNKALSRKTVALSKLGKYSDAYNVAKLWSNLEPENTQALKELNRLKKIVDALQEEGADEEDLNSSLDDVEARTPLESSDQSVRKTSTKGSTTSPPHQASSTSSSSSVHKKRGSKQQKSKCTDSSLYCSYCNVQCSTQVDLHLHCTSESHQSIIMSDDGRDWKHRPPPRGVTREEYMLCSRFPKCRFGDQCTLAHSDEELSEWRERYKYRQMKMQRAREKKLHGISYSEQILERWMNSPTPLNVLTESLDDVKITVNSDYNVTVSSKKSSHVWTYTLHCKAPRQLCRVALLYDIHRSHFCISNISFGDSKRQTQQEVGPNCQEWVQLKNNNNNNIKSSERLYRVKLAFTSEIFGTFRQSIVFDFGSEPVLMKRVCVDAVSPSDLKQIDEAMDTIICTTERWDRSNKTIISYDPPLRDSTDKDKGLLSFYTQPTPSEKLVNLALLQKNMTKNNYRSRLHDLLNIEEMAQFKHMSKYNVKTTLQLVSSFLLLPGKMQGAKYAVDGEMFAQMRLNDDLSDQTPGGRLILNSSSTVLLSSGSNKTNDTVYEAAVEEKGKGFIFLRLSKRCVDELRLRKDTEWKAEVQFQLNRLPVCEMHYAVDKVPDLDIVFPDTQVPPNIPWAPHRQWSEKLDPRLNAKQKEAVIAMTTPLDIKVPPILVIGPFGTGKTFTIAQATKLILQQPNTRILICTHSNSAADLYIKDYLHSYVEAGHSEAKPLRIYFKDRWVRTVNREVQPYCLIKDGFFYMPTKEDVLKHRVVVATLSTSRYLSHLDLEPGFFTHIFLDEAAQAMECETIMPLALASEHTRIVLAGDHMQLSPEVYSEFARERNLHVSLLERLFEYYPQEHSCKIMLCENYRSHEAIVDYTSRLFYEGRLLASGKQPQHTSFYPLTFFTARGEDVQDKNSTSFYNNAEVFEVVERVDELQKMWPTEWGTLDVSNIGVVSPYADQVFRIRSELRKRRLFGVDVERVLNVQGKQFRVLFISTVRTRNTCKQQRRRKPSRGQNQGAESLEDDEVNYGFLSDAKLLNTAITRAQSLVAVVGDPISLCSVGKCRKLWEQFIKICHENKSLYGITYSSIRSQLDGVELKKTYTLNPLAPEFIPRALRAQMVGMPFIQGSGAVTTGAGSLIDGSRAHAYQAGQAQGVTGTSIAGARPYGAFLPKAGGNIVRPASPVHRIDPHTGMSYVYMPSMYNPGIYMPVPLRVLPNGQLMQPYIDPGYAYPQRIQQYGMNYLMMHQMSPTGISVGAQTPPPTQQQQQQQQQQSQQQFQQQQQQTDKSQGNKDAEKQNQEGQAVAGRGVAKDGKHATQNAAESKDEVLAKMKERQLQEEYKYLVRTRGLEYANRFMATQKAQSANQMAREQARIEQQQQQQQQQHLIHPLQTKLLQEHLQKGQMGFDQQNFYVQQWLEQQQQQVLAANKALSGQGQSQGQGSAGGHIAAAGTSHVGRQQDTQAIQRAMGNMQNYTNQSAAGVGVSGSNQQQQHGASGSSQQISVMQQQGQASRAVDLAMLERMQRIKAAAAATGNMPNMAHREQLQQTPQKGGERWGGANVGAPAEDGEWNQLNSWNDSSFHWPSLQSSGGDMRQQRQPTSMGTADAKSPLMGMSSATGRNTPLYERQSERNSPAYRMWQQQQQQQMHQQEQHQHQQQFQQGTAAESYQQNLMQNRLYNQPLSPMSQPMGNNPASIMGVPSTPPHPQDNSPTNSASQQQQQQGQLSKQDIKTPAGMSYASALRAPPKPKPKPVAEERKTASPDPLSLIKDLNIRSNSDGYYSYFN